MLTFEVGLRCVLCVWWKRRNDCNLLLSTPYIQYDLTAFNCFFIATKSSKTIWSYCKKYEYSSYIDHFLLFSTMYNGCLMAALRLCFLPHIRRSAKRRGYLLTYSQAELGRELTQPRKHLLAEPCTDYTHLLSIHHPAIVGYYITKEHCTSHK